MDELTEIDDGAALADEVERQLDWDWALHSLLIEENLCRLRALIAEERRRAKAEVRALLDEHQLREPQAEPRSTAIIIPWAMPARLLQA